MPIDASIAMGYQQPKFDSPLNTLAQFMQVQHAQGQNALAQYSLNKAQRSDDESNSLAQLVRNGGVDPTTPEGIKQIYGVAPLTGSSYVQGLLKNNESLATTAKNTAEAGKFNADATSKSVATARDSLANINDPQGAAAWLTQAYSDPHLKPLTSGTPIDQALTKIPQDPEGFAQWKQQMALGATKFMEINKPSIHMQDTGTASNVVAVPGLGGAPQVLSTTPKGVSPNTAATIANSQSIHNTPSGGDILKIDPYGTLGYNKNAPQGAAGTSTLTGDEYLATLPPSVSSQVKMLAEGKLPLTAQALRSPQVMQLLTMASQYEPGTDATTYTKRAATAKDAASGKLATSNNALNTVAGHLSALADSADALNNTRFPLVNSIVNSIESNAGDPRVKTFNLNMQGVADELERAYRGAGGSEGSIKLWRENLGSSNSPAQFDDVMKKAAEMLQSKLEANQAQYEQGMSGRPGDYKSITPKAAAALAKLRGEPAPATPDSVGPGTPAAGKATAPAPKDLEAEMRRRGLLK